MAWTEYSEFWRGLRDASVQAGKSGDRGQRQQASASSVAEGFHLADMAAAYGPRMAPALSPLSRSADGE